MISFKPTLLTLLLIGCAQAQHLPRPPLTEAVQNSWYANTTFYQVFVRSFQDSDGDGIGDLRGVASRLEYLKNLGVGAIWLMPIYPSPSYHGYDVTDHQNIQPEYGTLQDFKTLLEEAHKHNIKVILDWIPNHTSDQHPWFKDARRPGSSKRDWYVWKTTNPGWGRPWDNQGQTWHKSGDQFYYGVFWGGMPDLNWKNPQVKSAMDQAAQFWLDLGVDGFRVDASRYILEGETDNRPDSAETLNWTREFTQMVKAHGPDKMVVTEAWIETPTVAKYFVDGQGQDLGFDFDLQTALVTGIQTANATPILETLDGVTRHYPEGAVDGIFVSNHDLGRPNFTPGQWRVAASLLLTLPGTPFLYYGQEIGMPNGTGPSDEQKRTPMRWTFERRTGFSTAAPWQPFSTQDPLISVQSQQEEPTSLLKHHQTLLHIRQQHGALRTGGYLPLAAPDGVIGFIRQLGKERVLVVVNLQDTGQQVQLDLGSVSAGVDTAQSLLGSLEVKAGKAVGTIPAQGLALLLLNSP
ncbi:alpha-amylase family glycosyl hydrolase [Deinococcus cellulosilyticus]|uniref:alpha-amylase family glycosyl hydrolase n=1 Tax=Deinococcus cellulosilyticus TaxID=401558 RepID=UPI001649B8BB|nr:alpha-amylase family glycosyl hydrolase [Deinococcus cellulosilyticus]